MARAQSFFTMSNSPLRGVVPRSPSRSRDAFVRPGVASFSFYLRRISAAFVDAQVGLRPKSWRQQQIRPRTEGPAERREAHCLTCRARTARRHACEA